MASIEHQTYRIRLLKRVVVNALAVIGFVASCIQISQWVRTPPTEVSAVAVYRVIPMIPEVRAQLQRLPKIIPAVQAQVSAARRFRRAPITAPLVDDIDLPGDLLGLLKTYLDGISDDVMQEALSPGWFVAVTNHGTTTATTVALHVPGFTKARLQLPGASDSTMIVPPN